MRKYFFDPDGQLPVVKATLAGPLGSKRVLLVFDSGAQITQVHTEILNFLGYTEAIKTGIVSIAGVTGPAEVGYEVRMDEFSVLGRMFGEARIAAIDFSRWQEEGLDGLLGWDFIRRFHFDMDGPRGKLEVY